VAKRDKMSPFACSHGFGADSACTSSSVDIVPDPKSMRTRSDPFLASLNMIFSG